MSETQPLPSPELSKIIKLSEIGGAALTGNITADDSQGEALAKRFELPSIESLSADYRLEAKEHKISFTGSIRSDLHQNCAISGQPFPVKVAEEFDIIFVEKSDNIFVEKSDNPPAEEEIELEAEDCDIIEYE